MEILGIDIGGSGIKGAIVETKNGELITDRKRIPTPQPATPEAMLQTVKELVDFFGWKGVIGCGFPAAVQHDIVRTASNIDKSWIGLNAAKKIEKLTGCPTHVVNDVDAAGLAEMKIGAGKNEQGVTIMLAAGTGIGSAIFIKKQLVPNMELGFIHVNGMPGEHYAANSVREKENLDWKTWAGRFNEYLHRLDLLFWPDLFILGGGVSKKFDQYGQYFDVKTPVIPAKTKNHAGIIGAALAAKDEGLKVK
ncbi:MAG: polyphosphate--glucose phosphotransferase [Cyclobacteriaceae bacterium]